jgi:DNA adenine methylase
MVASVKPLTTYYGGKSLTRGKHILRLLPQHRNYCEFFGGMAGVLMAKQPSFIEVYNDMHSGVVTLMRVVRDPAHRQRLLELLEFTPHSREEWNDCDNHWADTDDPIEVARRVYVMLSQSFTGATRNGAWSCGGTSSSENVARSFSNSFENIKAVGKRLQNVIIENQPALELMDRWDHPDSLWYLDPPYHPDTRTHKHKRKGGIGHNYLHEMDDSDHRELLERLLRAKAMIILSGYKSKLYQEVLEKDAGWTRWDFAAMSTAALQSDRNGLKGQSVEVMKRVESLWFNPAAKPATLFDYPEQAV